MSVAFLIGTAQNSNPQALEYALSEDETYYIVTGVRYLRKDYIIPDTYNNLPVKEIAEEAFRGNKTIERIEGGNNVERIGSGAFRACSYLLQVFFPQNLTYIGTLAFQSCASLSNITIPEKVETVDEYAFRYCEKLTTVYIDGSPSFKAGVFEGCNISAVWAKESKWHGITRANWYSNPLHNGATLYFDEHRVSALTLSANHTPKPYEYAGCTSIRDVVIENRVKFIWESAFEDCANLRYVTIPETVIEIHENAFKNCVNLRGDGSTPEYASDVGNVAYLKLPGNLIIHPHAFENCSSLEWVDIGENFGELTWNNGADGKYLVIGAYAFKGCTSLYNTTISKYWVATGYNAFAETDLRYLDLVDEPSLGMWLADSTNNNWTRAPFIENYEKSCAEFYMEHTEEIIFLSGYNLTYGDILRGDEA